MNTKSKKADRGSVERSVRLSGAMKRHIAKCANKTAAGNVYDSAGEAWASARAQRKSKLWLSAYPCRACGKWHIGKTFRTAMWANDKVSDCPPNH